MSCAVDGRRWCILYPRLVGPVRMPPVAGTGSESDAAVSGKCAWSRWLCRMCQIASPASLHSAPPSTRLNAWPSSSLPYNSFRAHCVAMTDPVGDTLRTTVRLAAVVTRCDLGGPLPWPAAGGEASTVCAIALPLCSAHPGPARPPHRPRAPASGWCLESRDGRSSRTHRTVRARSRCCSTPPAPSHSRARPPLQ